MFTGITLALSACFIWGLIFIVPLFMEGFNAIEIATSRYFFYGAGSLLFFLKKRGRYSAYVWKISFLNSFVALIYYPCVVLGLFYATPAMCALILGTAPITIAVYGNWKEKECSYRSLVFPSVFIFLGLLMVNAPELGRNEAPATYLLGLASCLVALAAWSWFAVANARFLRSNREVSSIDWTVLNGVCTLVWVLIFMIGAACFGSIEIEKYITMTPQLKSFLIGSAILGVLCSGVGIVLWNKAALHLPISLAGQLMIFETIFGLIFIYLLQQRLPLMMECLGIALFMVAIVYGIRKFASRISIS
jgi:drug/metabolite transporter (DMT)-like permease